MHIYRLMCVRERGEGQRESANILLHSILMSTRKAFWQAYASFARCFSFVIFLI